MRVRLLVGALLAQLVLGTVLIVVATQGIPWFQGGAASADQGNGPRHGLRQNRFNSDRAFGLIRSQVAVGQRPAGSPQLRALAQRLRRLLPHGRFEVVPGHPGLRNIVGTLAGRGPAVVLGAHYDTEFHPPGFVGANDGAAGTAAVIELARDMANVKRRAGAPALRFVLFDGEEEPPGHSSQQEFLAFALRGSRAYVAAHRGEVRAMVLLDYIANKGLRLPREGSSTAGLWFRLRSAAGRVGARATFPPTPGTVIYDDHTPFLAARIASIDLIDFNYAYKDTVADTVDKLSPDSLDRVGETVAELLRVI